jgi:ribosomal protein S18 acetylase RimI-like enzyme
MRFRQETASGLDYLELVTRLLHRVRAADPVAGFWEAADLQWWWRTPRSSDEIGQLFWVDDDGPIGAAILTDWGHAWGCDPIVVPEAADDLFPVIWSQAEEVIDARKLATVEVRVRDDDPLLREMLAEAGFTLGDEAGASTWMRASDRPDVPAPPEGFALTDRAHIADHPHPLVTRNGPDVEARLNQCSLYDSELDLAVVAPTGDIAGYGVFWFDPVTRVGLVEPMRTEDAYQRLGIARAVLCAGLERLSNRGADRLKVGYVSDPARNLYLGAGFEVESTDRMYVRNRPA